MLWFAVLGWWLGIAPQNDRDWQADVARLPHVTQDGDRVTIRNVRDFDYRSETDFTERWEDRTYDLAQVRGADLFISYWGPTVIAHTLMSWEFADGRHLAISIETRKEQGEYSALRGSFRQYELCYGSPRHFEPFPNSLTPSRRCIRAVPSSRMNRRGPDFS